MTNLHYIPSTIHCSSQINTNFLMKELRNIIKFLKKNNTSKRRKKELCKSRSMNTWPESSLHQLCSLPSSLIALFLHLKLWESLTLTDHEKQRTRNFKVWKKESCVMKGALK